jgi:hypothetical protein
MLERPKISHRKAGGKQFGYNRLAKLQKKEQPTK